MPALSRPSSNSPIPSLVFTPPNPASYFQRPQPTPITPDTTGASASLAYAEIAKALGAIPGGIMESYQKGKETGQANAIADKVAGKIASGDLSGISMDSTGKATYTDPSVKAAGKQGDLYNYLQGQMFDGQPQAGSTAPIGAKPSSTETPAIPAIPASPDASASSGYFNGDGSVFSLVPDGKGGFKDDPHDKIDKGVPGFSATTGAYGHNIKDPDLMGVAITPEDMKKAGINPNDRKSVAGHQVEVIGPDGNPILLDIVDKNGTPGRADFTLAAYNALGGPDEENGGLIKGIKYRIVPRSASQAVAPDKREQIETAAANIGQQLTGGNIGDLSASNSPSSVPPATLKPASGDLAGVPVRRATIGRDPQSGLMLYSPSPTQMIAVTPGGQRIDVSPPASASKQPTGMTFPNAEAAKTAGLDPEGATVNPDGTITIEKYKPGGTDDKGRGKITDAQKNKLVSATDLAQEMEGIEGTHKRLYADNKAGPIAGRWQSFWAGTGHGDADFVEANGTIKVANFKIARLLNGPGVLTDKDIQRAQEVAPTLNETPESFAAKMRAVRKSLTASIHGWLAVNAGQATPEQEAAANKALEALGEAPAGGSAAATQPGGTPAAAPAQDINAQAQEILNDYKAGKFDNDPRKKAIEEKLRSMGLLGQTPARSATNITAAIEG